MSTMLDLKTQKYDRQLRLWATSGQEALEQADICLLNVNSTGCEILKNLVLPGVGKVTVVDANVVTKEDIKSNFFLDPEGIGKSKASSAAELLQELNEDAIVKFVEKNPVDLIESEPDFFGSFTLIIAVNIPDYYVSKLSRLCYETEKVLLKVKSKGLVGYFAVQAPEHTIIESHPENVSDLRLATPFQQLLDYVSTIDLDALDQTDHGHVPFVVIILKYVESWKADQEGKLPQSYQERQELIKKIRAGMRTPDEENFEEAISNVWRLANTNKISTEVRRIFEDPSCVSADVNSPSFWILARAVREFVENEGDGQLPLSGKLPDMKSDTLGYISLQNVYREKSLSDLNAVKNRVKNILKGSSITIPDETIELFCKNAANIQVIQYKLLGENHLSAEKLANFLKNEENFVYYFTFKAADKFEAEHGHLPASESDYEQLKQQVELLMIELGISSEDATELMKSDTFDKVILNYVRFNNLETPNLAALLGGLAAQEVIKLITHQYIPINNTCVFNGITSTSNVYEV